MIKQQILEILNSHVGKLFDDYQQHVIEYKIKSLLQNAKANYAYDFNIIRVYKNWLIIDVTSFNRITTYELKFDKNSGVVEFYERTN